MTVKIQTIKILLKKSRWLRCLAQKNDGDMSHTKNIQAEKPSAMGLIWKS